MSDFRLAVCHPDDAVRAGIAARLHGAHVEAYAGSPRDHDAVLVCGRVNVEPILAAGTHVLLVANPCPAREALELLTATASKHRVQFSAVNPDRYLPSRQLIRRQIGGSLGEAGLVRLHRWEPASNTSEVAGLPEPLLRDLDTTLWLVGRVPDRVFAVEHRTDAGRFIQVHLGFSHGGMALLDYTNRLPAGEGYASLSVIAATGAAYADDHQNTQLLFRGGSPLGVRTEETAGQFATLARDFIESLHAGRDLAASISAWKDVFALAAAVAKSLASGTAVEVG